MENIIVNCPACGTRMHKSGHRMSGHNKRTRYACPRCGTTTIKTGAKTDGQKPIL
jgi:transposase-like protein